MEITPQFPDLVKREVAGASMPSQQVAQNNSNTYIIIGMAIVIIILFAFAVYMWVNRTEKVTGKKENSKPPPEEKKSQEKEESKPVNKTPSPAENVVKKSANETNETDENNETPVEEVKKPVQKDELNHEQLVSKTDLDELKKYAKAD